MFAMSSAEVMPLALSLVLLILFILLGGWNVWLNARLRDLLRDSAALQQNIDALRQVKTFEQELRDVVRLRLGERFDTQSSSDLALLDEALKARLPALIRRELEQPSAELESSMRAKLFRQAADRIGDVIGAMGDRVQGALQQRLARLIDDSDDEWWEQLDERLGERVAALIASLDTAKDVELESRIRVKLVRRLEELFEDPDAYSDWFEDIDARLGDRVCRHAEDPSEECVAEMSQMMDRSLRDRLETIIENSDEYEDLFSDVDGKIGEILLERIDDFVSDEDSEIHGQMIALVGEQVIERAKNIFEDAENYESFFETIDERLCERILRFTERLPEELADTIDERIHQGLITEVDHLFEQPDSHEDLFLNIDESLGKRISRLIDHPPTELKERLDERVSQGLSLRLQAMFEKPEDYSEALGEVHEQLAKRIERRLREELARGNEGLIERIMADEVGKQISAKKDKGE
jgi:predicted negative regulator of RcsB-dependent stress response